MGNKVTLYVEPPEIGVQWTPSSAEAVPMDKLRAMEIGLFGLTKNVIELRQSLGLRVPAIYAALIEADPARELL